MLPHNKNETGISILYKRNLNILFSRSSATPVECKRGSSKKRNDATLWDLCSCILHHGSQTLYCQGSTSDTSIFPNIAGKLLHFENVLQLNICPVVGYPVGIRYNEDIFEITSAERSLAQDIVNSLSCSAAVDKQNVAAANNFTGTNGRDCRLRIDISILKRRLWHLNGNYPFATHQIQKVLRVQKARLRYNFFAHMFFIAAKLTRQIRDQKHFFRCGADIFNRVQDLDLGF